MCANNRRWQPCSLGLPAWRSSCAHECKYSPHCGLRKPVGIFMANKTENKQICVRLINSCDEDVRCTLFILFEHDSHEEAPECAEIFAWTPLAVSSRAESACPRWGSRGLEGNSRGSRGTRGDSRGARGELEGTSNRGTTPASRNGEHKNDQNLCTRIKCCWKAMSVVRKPKNFFLAAFNLIQWLPRQLAYAHRPAYANPPNLSDW